MFAPFPMGKLCKMYYRLFDKDKPSPELQPRAEGPPGFDEVCATAQFLHACPCAGSSARSPVPATLSPHPPRTRPAPRPPQTPQCCPDLVLTRLLQPAMLSERYLCREALAGNLAVTSVTDDLPAVPVPRPCFSPAVTSPAVSSGSGPLPGAVPGAG